MVSVNSPLVKKNIGWVLLIVLLWGAAVSEKSYAEANNLSETIEYLLAFVKNSECRFFRNDKEHTAGEAAAHMQRKYEHFKDKIKTAEDFIRLTATKSLMTGKLYYVILKGGKKITSEAWLLQALEAYRKKQ
jgi:hypothetical protein